MDAKIIKLTARAYKIPTDSPEADGTFEWDSTTLVLVTVEAGGKQGIGYSYASRASAIVIEDLLVSVIQGMSAFDVKQCWQNMCKSVRNIGRSGVAACAISAVDNALWDLKAKLLNIPLINLLVKYRDAIPVYGSGGFTTYGPKEITKQIEEWQKLGIAMFKIKIGRNEQSDLNRIKAASKILSKDAQLFVDANGAYQPKQAVDMALKMAEYNVKYFEEPVSADDVKGLNFVREHSEMDIAAGEYCYNQDDFVRILQAKAVDILQADATRCLGITGFFQAANLADAYHRPLSSHCAPSLHEAVMCSVVGGIHMEYFWDHTRIEDLLFDNVTKVKNGMLTAQTSEPGFGFEFKTKDAERFAI